MLSDVLVSVSVLLVEILALLVLLIAVVKYFQQYKYYR